LPDCVIMMGCRALAHNLVQVTYQLTALIFREVLITMWNTHEYCVCGVL